MQFVPSMGGAHAEIGRGAVSEWLPGKIDPIDREAVPVPDDAAPQPWSSISPRWGSMTPRSSGATRTGPGLPCWRSQLSHGYTVTCPCLLSRSRARSRRNTAGVSRILPAGRPS